MIEGFADVRNGGGVVCTGAVEDGDGAVGFVDGGEVHLAIAVEISGDEVGISGADGVAFGDDEGAIGLLVEHGDLVGIFDGDDEIGFAIDVEIAVGEVIGVEGRGDFNAGVEGAVS